VDLPGAELTERFTAPGQPFEIGERTVLGVVLVPLSTWWSGAELSYAPGVRRWEDLLASLGDAIDAERAERIGRGRAVVPGTAGATPCRMLNTCRTLNTPQRAST
jgi:hypothetical protein